VFCVKAYGFCMVLAVNSGYLLNNINQLIFVGLMVKCSVLFEVRADFLNVIYTRLSLIVLSTKPYGVRKNGGIAPCIHFPWKAEWEFTLWVGARSHFAIENMCFHVYPKSSKKYTISFHFFKKYFHKVHDRLRLLTSFWVLGVQVNVLMSKAAPKCSSVICPQQRQFILLHRRNLFTYAIRWNI
jgi:hypothetical protein